MFVTVIIAACVFLIVCPVRLETVFVHPYKCITLNKRIDNYINDNRMRWFTRETFFNMFTCIMCDVGSSNLQTAAKTKEKQQ